VSLIKAECVLLLHRGTLVTVPLFKGVQMKETIVGSISGLLVLIAMMHSSGYLKAEEECSPAAGLSYICGPVGAEDLVRIPDTRWIIGSGMAENNNPGKLHLIDSDKKTWSILYPGKSAQEELDTISYPACPGPPDVAKFGAHGISIRDDGNGRSTVLAVNHGREAIEVFKLNTSGEKPSIRWVGCIPMDETIYVNSVAFLPGDGLVFTKFYDRRARPAFGNNMAPKLTGGVFEWHPKTGVRPIAGTELSLANGIVSSKDGRLLYVAAWGTQQLVRYTRRKASIEKDVVEIDFSPDNLRWAPDGKILVAGQNRESNTAGGMSPFKGWTVAKLDPETMEVNEILKDHGESPLQNASAAIEVDGTLWIGSFRADRVAYKPAQ
jgi:hypothetical protein